MDIGITPARAGKTIMNGMTLSFRRDHPRSCGKDSSLPSGGDRRHGSPPLVRERQNDRTIQSENFRITPARAGKTTVIKAICITIGDHPRSCGKDGKTDSHDKKESGSPPLVRERLTTVHEERRPRRITPARAGKTENPARGSSAAQDHPRSCGKDSKVISHRARIMGSPPLVRERRRTPLRRYAPSGITPARAGKTWCVFVQTRCS